MTEYADHLHEHMVQRLVVERRPLPGPDRARASGVELEPASLARYRFPDGEHWARRR